MLERFLRFLGFREIGGKKERYRGPRTYRIIRCRLGQLTERNNEFTILFSTYRNICVYLQVSDAYAVEVKYIVE